MHFCPNCGAQLTDHAKFCPNCGKPCAEPDAQFYSERKQEYRGTVRKCPACGEEVPSFTAVCPTCGHEFNSAKVSSAQQEFVRQLEECDYRIAVSPHTAKKGWVSWSTSKKVCWVFLNIMFAFIPLFIYWLMPVIRYKHTPPLSPEERRKAEIIENYTVPNDRETVLEALLFAETKITFLAEEKSNQQTAYWCRLWAMKAAQLYKKAQIIMPGDPIVEDIYSKIQTSSTKVNKKMKRKATLAIVALVLLFLAGMSGDPEAGNSSKVLIWPNQSIAQDVPVPDAEFGKVERESEHIVEIVLFDVTQDDFEAYVQKCRDAGFTGNLDKTETSYEANNGGNLTIHILYDEISNEMELTFTD